MTLSHHKRQVERARKAYDKASSALCDWAIANGHGHTKYKVAPPELWQAARTAREQYDAAEQAAVADGCAWRGTFGLLTWYDSRDVRRWGRAGK